MTNVYSTVGYGLKEGIIGFPEQLLNVMMNLMPIQICSMNPKFYRWSLIISYLYVCKKWKNSNTESSSKVLLFIIIIFMAKFYVEIHKITEH